MAVIDTDLKHLAQPPVEAEGANLQLTAIDCLIGQIKVGPTTDQFEGTPAAIAGGFGDGELSKGAVLAILTVHFSRKHPRAGDEITFESEITIQPRIHGSVGVFGVDHIRAVADA